MHAARTKVRSILATVLCASLFVWSVTPSFNHASMVFQTIHDHLEMVEHHGHSHGFAEDLYWAMHGHTHDVADHDHNHAILSLTPRTRPVAAVSEASPGMVSIDGPTRHFRIERPPRA